MKGQVYSPWGEITSGVPQGSLLGPPMFIIDMCDIFFVLNNHEIASYADDNTLTLLVTPSNLLLHR